MTNYSSSSGIKFYNTSSKIPVSADCEFFRNGQCQKDSCKNCKEYRQTLE